MRKYVLKRQPVSALEGCLQATNARLGR